MLLPVDIPLFDLYQFSLNLPKDESIEISHKSINQFLNSLHQFGLISSIATTNASLTRFGEMVS